MIVSAGPGDTPASMHPAKHLQSHRLKAHQISGGAFFVEWSSAHAWGELELETDKPAPVPSTRLLFNISDNSGATALILGAEQNWASRVRLRGDDKPSPWVEILQPELFHASFKVTVLHSNALEVEWSSPPAESYTLFVSVGSPTNRSRVFRTQQPAPVLIEGINPAMSIWLQVVLSHRGLR